MMTRCLVCEMGEECFIDILIVASCPVCVKFNMVRCLKVKSLP